MKNFIFAILLAFTAFLSNGREIVLLDGPFKADWSDKHCVDPMQLAGVVPGDKIHVYTSNLSNYAQAFIRTKGNGWQAISPEFDSVRIFGDFECVLDQHLIEVIEDEVLMFGGDGYTIEKVTLITDRPEVVFEGYDELCDKNASDDTKRIYNLLRDCYGKRSISCSMAEVDWNYKEAGYVKSWTGMYPAMNGFDYIHLTYDWEYYSDITPVKEWWDMGGLVTICWHWRAPDSQSVWEAYKASNNEKTVFEGFYANGGGSPTTSFSAANAVKEGTWENEFVMSDIAKVASKLKKLQEAGIVVVWRPLHEAAGNSTIYNDGKAWFWWGADGPEPCVELWKMMFDYFQKVGIHNLIWVWTSQTKDKSWYPGDEYVDMIGRDLYNYSVEDAAYNFKYLSTYYPNKMLALSECGYSGGTSPYMSEQWNEGAKWSYAMPWYHYEYKLGGNHQYANDDWWKDWFNADHALTLDDMKTLRADYLKSDVSGVDTVLDEFAQHNDDEWFTIQGVKVTKPTSPGIYIRNGKKIIIK